MYHDATFYYIFITWLCNYYFSSGSEVDSPQNLDKMESVVTIRKQNLIIHKPLNLCIAAYFFVLGYNLYA